MLSWIYGLYAAWAACLLGGWFLGAPHGPDAARIPTLARLFSSAALVAVAWLFFARETRGPRERFRLLIAIGMSFGFVGDTLLAGPVSGALALPAGMGAFALGHVAYLTAILGVARSRGISPTPARFAFSAGWLAVSALIWYFTVARGFTPDPVMKWAALGYSLLLGSVFVAGAIAAREEPSLWPCALGVTLFWMSDAVLAANLFNHSLFASLPLAIRGDLVWILYGPAQALIVFGML